MDQTTRNLASVITSISFESLPENVVHQTKRRLLDSIGCAAGAYGYPIAANMRQTALSQLGQKHARVWFSGDRSTIELAGLANGAMVRYLDLSDTILAKSAGHPSDMIPALVALAEASDATGKTLIAAIVAAYEAYCGLCSAVAFQKAGIDQSTAAALGAAAGASRILDLDLEQTAQSLAIALSSNLNLYNVRQGALSDWKALAGPSAAKAGVFAAQLAAKGLTGPSAVFDGKSGFKEIVGPFELAEDCRVSYHLLNTHLKAFPVCYHGQSAVDAAKSIAGKVAPQDIRSVLVETYDVAFQMMANDPSRWEPKNRETADHSIPFVVGTVLATKTLRPSDYSEKRFGDSDFRAFMKKIKVRPSVQFTTAYPRQTRSRVTIESVDGEAFASEIIQPKGHVENPMSDDELNDKVLDLWGTEIHVDSSKVIDLVMIIDRLENVGDFIDALCPSNVNQPGH